MNCIKEVRKSNTPCQVKGCRKWIDYKKDLNCVLESIKKIESAAIKKLQRMNLEQFEDEN